MSARNNNTPWSIQYDLPALAAYAGFSAPEERIEQIYKEEYFEGESQPGPWVCAVGMEADISPDVSGQWDTIPEKGLVWRMGIHAENALSLNLLIEKYQLQPGMNLYVYNGGATNIEGPFDSENNKNGGVLPVPLLSGNTLIIEWNIPDGLTGRNDFVITNVGYGFRGTSEYSGIRALATSASCNIDITCPTGSPWQREQRSVVRMETTTYEGGYSRTQYCTGTLVNQATDNKKPYILTANHCISTNEMAQRTLFSFGYEKPTCGGTAPTVLKRLTGSSLVATKQELDMTLLELTQPITEDLHPYYAGWNASSNAPLNGAGIHHPYGDVKKISIDNNAPVTATFNDTSSDFNCDENAHWRILEWEKGITEKGSSGSPLFDQNHLVVGVLTGGETRCSSPKDDYYAKFSEQWSKYPDSKENLISWLNPDNKPIQSLEGYDPISGFEEKFDTISHIGTNEKELLIASDRWGYLTGHNDKGWISFAEKMDNDTTVKILGIAANIAEVQTNGSRVKFSIWKGNEFPIGDPVWSMDTLIASDYKKYPMHIYFRNVLEVTDNFFVGYSIDYIDSRPGNTFAVFQADKRSYEGVSSLYIEDGTSWNALKDIELAPTPVYSSLGMKVMGKFGKGKKPELLQEQSNRLKINFQPDRDYIEAYFIDPPRAGMNVNIECFDMTGKQVPVDILETNIEIYDETYLKVVINTSHLSYGMYVLRISDDRKTRSGKFLRL